MEQYPTANDAVITSEKIIIFSPHGFKKFLANKVHFNFRSEEIIHDPTLAVTLPEVVEQPVEAEPTVKKQPYFGSEKHKADLEAKKQLKNQEQ